MRLLALGVLAAGLVTSANAQVRPRPPVPKPGQGPIPVSPKTPRAPEQPPEPLIWDWPEVPRPGSLFDLHVPMVAPLPPMGIEWEDAERQWKLMQKDSEKQWKAMHQDAEWQLRDRQFEMEHELQARQMDLKLAQRGFEDARLHALWDFESPKGMGPGRSFSTVPPAPRKLEDQADSLYKSAREMLTRGEYRRAASMFSDLAAKHPNSEYGSSALYWQAYSLYRIGGTPELRSALDALRAQETKYPTSRAQADVRTLATRILGALAARGDAAAAAQIRGTASDSALRCDREEQSVRVEALKAVIESDPESAMPLLQRTLSRTDECSASLRQTAVFMLGSKRRDGPGVALLSQVAKTDPNVEVRGSALEWLARMPGEDALVTIETLSRDSSDERIQRAAVRALVAHPSARARVLVRGVVERPEVPERLRMEALSAFSKERSTNEDVTWLRALYSKTENPRIKSRIVSALTRIGGSEVDAWLLTVARDADEDSETRSYAMRRIAETQPIAELAKLYDAAAQRSVRETLIEAFAKRSEAEATDKLIDIVKNGTDPNLRSRAINALTRKKDPRTMQLLMELVSK